MMKKWLAAIMAAGCIFAGGFGVAHAADWYYVDADADDSAWFIDNSSVFKTDSMARILVKANNVDGYTYIYTVEINRPDSTWTEVNATVYSQSGVALLSSNEKQKPVKIEKDTIGAEVMQALWGK
nr:hypothetical protein [uncultured Veillonella sp.]